MNVAQMLDLLHEAQEKLSEIEDHEELDIIFNQEKDGTYEVTVFHTDQEILILREDA